MTRCPVHPLSCFPKSGLSVLPVIVPLATVATTMPTVAPAVVIVASISTVSSIPIGAVVISIAVAHSVLISVLIVPVALARIASQCQAAETENHQQTKNNSSLKFHNLSPFRDLVWFSSDGVFKGGKLRKRNTE